MPFLRRRSLARSLSALAVLLACGCHGRSVTTAAQAGQPTDVVALAAFDPAAVGPGAPPRPEPPRTLEVVDYGPQGRSAGSPEIHVRFNQPVVALGLADSSDLAGRFTIDPPLPGRVFWKSPELLVLEPFGKPRPGYLYTVRFDGAVGEGGPRPLTWTFETPRPTVVGSVPRTDPADPDSKEDEREVQRRDTRVLVEFDRPVTLKQAQAHLQATTRSFTGTTTESHPVRVRAATRDEVTFRHYGDELAVLRTFVVQPRRPWPVDCEVTVSVTPGLLAEEGPLPLDTPWSMVFRTQGPQAIVRMGCDPFTPCGLEPITLRLRNPVDPQQLRKITVTPRPKKLEIGSPDDWGEGGREVVIEGQLVPGTDYTIVIPEALRDIHGQGIVGGAIKVAVIAPRATLALSEAGGILRPGPARTIGVESRHVTALRVRIGIYTDAELQAIALDSDPARLDFPARVLERRLPLTPSGQADWSSLALDLAELSGGALRPVLVEVAAAELTPRAVQYGLPAPVRGLFRLTDLGLVATTSLPASQVQVLRLSTGQPVPGARVHGSATKASEPLLDLGVTDASGLLNLPPAFSPLLPAARDAKSVLPPLRLTVVDPVADDHAHIDLAHVDRSGGALRPGEHLIARLIRERGVYRPGEKVRVVGWSAVDTPFSRSNLGRLAAGTGVEFKLLDHRKKLVATHRTRTTAEGKFWAELQIPAGAALGRYTVEAILAGGHASTSVKVEDYRVPEFTVDARARRSDILLGEQTTIDVRASYYFGGPVPISRVARTIQCQGRRFRPPGLEDSWQAGDWPDGVGSIRTGEHGARAIMPAPAVPTPGLRELQAGGDPSQARYAQQCLLSAAVQDVSMQEHGAEVGFTVHPAAFYLAVRLPAGSVEAGQRVSVPLRAVSPAGERLAVAKVDVLVTRHWDERTYRTESGKRVVDGWAPRSAKVGHCTLDLPASGADPVCNLPALLEGRYELAVSAAEPGSPRVAHTRGIFYVDPKVHSSSTDWLAAPIERLEVLVDHTRVQPGDTLEVAVRAPWPEARGNLVLARGGVRETHPIVLVDHEARFKFSVDDSWTPMMNFHAAVVVPAGPGRREQPRVERAEATVYQGFEQRRLKVAVEAPGQARPGEAIALRVRVHDEQDRPVAARVALWAVDEAVLALTGYEVPDLLPDFVSKRWAEITIRDDYERLLLPFIAQREDPWYGEFGQGLLRRRSSRKPMMRQGSAQTQDGPSAPAAPRARFDTTPVFLADLAVDRSGEVKVTTKLPDNLTTFRITAIASARLADGSGVGRFGKNDARTQVTAPLVLRAAMPRQLRPGDRAELAAIVQNNTGRAGRLEVTAHLVEATGTKEHALEFTSPPSSTTEVTEGGQARVVFAVRALAPGVPELELRASLVANGDKAITDALRLPLPVTAERTLTERVAVYGSIVQDHAVEIPIKMPTAVLPAYGGVTIAATSTLLGGLEDAVHALVEYPYGCVEQSASRLLPIVALEQLGTEYPLGVSDTKEFMRSGVERLLAMQTESGGFSYWPGEQRVHVYASAYATWVLQRARAAGYPVPKAALGRALDDLERRVARLDLATLSAGPGEHHGIHTAIALHTLADAGRPVHEPAAGLYTVRQRLPLFARAFLLMAMHREDPGAPEVRTLLAELLADIRELPGSAYTSASMPGLEAVFDSDGRSDAIVLMALLRVEPKHPRVLKLARGLLDRRVGGVWRNTQENAYALLALVDYARVYEARLPDFSARAWVGGANVLDAKFKGRELAPQTSFTDMATILRMPQKPGEALLPVVLARAGVGPLFYRIGAEWAPAQADLPARAQGFTVTRYLRTTAGPATDAITAGEALAMDITVRSEVRVRHVVVDVPLPAGLEGVSHTLGVGRSAQVLAGQRGWWVSHEEQRPDRVLVFADDLPPGTHTHTIDLRATSRGRFSFPPAQAEAMYIPEVYGRSVGATLEVR